MCERLCKVRSLQRPQYFHRFVVSLLSAALFQGLLHGKKITDYYSYFIVSLIVAGAEAFR